MPHISNINTWAACRPSGASLAVFMKYSSGLMQDSVDLLLSFVSMVFRDNIWRSHYLGIYKILCADVYFNASCSAGTAHISTIWGLTAQKRPCNLQENSAGHRGHFQRFIEGYGITGPVYQALGPLSNSHAHAALCQFPRGKMLIATRNAPVQSHTSTHTVK